MHYYSQYYLLSRHFPTSLTSYWLFLPGFLHILKHIQKVIFPISPAHPDAKSQLIGKDWCWRRLRAGGEGNREWDGWMASSTQWTWVWANSGRQWRTGKPGMLQSMGLQRVQHEWATEQKGDSGWEQHNGCKYNLQNQSTWVQILVLSFLTVSFWTNY